jgi:hypothetical protein
VSPTLVPDCGNPNAVKTTALPERHTPAWWTAQTKAFDFRGPDRVNTKQFNRVLWRGQMGEARAFPG